MFARQLADASTLTHDPILTKRWTRNFLYLWAAILVIRVGILVFSGLELAGDEAYYWEWSRQPDWGYFSKPPFIAWAMKASTTLFGPTTFGLRMGAVLFTSGGLLALFYLARCVFSAEAGFWAVLITALSPGNTAMALLFTIDAPLVCAWILSLWASWQLISHPKWSWKWASLLLPALGMGYLSKQMMLVFPLLLIAYLIFEPTHRGWLKRPAFWLLILASGLFLLPPLLWNWQHEWITFQHTAETNMRSAPVSMIKQMSRFVEYTGAELMLISPLIYVLLLWLLASALLNWKSLQPGERFLWIFSAPGLLVFFVVALKIRALPNWPAVFYPGAVVLIGAYAGNQLSFRQMKKNGQRWLRVGWQVSAVLTALIVLLTQLSPFLPFPRDPLRRLRGWSEFAERIEIIEARETQAAAPLNLLVAGHRYYASELAFYHSQQPRVFVWNDSGHPTSQYDLWAGIESASNEETLIIVPEGEALLPESLQAAFSDLSLIEEFTVKLNHHSDSRGFAVYKGTRTEKGSLQ